jgi:hypothetical protein
VAEGGGLLNRYRVVKPYRGFESLRLRQFYPIVRLAILRHSDQRDGRRHRDGIVNDIK